MEEKNWWSLTFQEKLLEVHRCNLFPELRDKNRIDFLNILIEKLINKTESMSDFEINEFFE